MNTGPPTDRGRLAQALWDRHANPRSVWTLVATYPVLVVALYRRSGRLLAGSLLFVLLQPVLFSPAEDDSAWASRVVRGEQAWLADGVRSSPLDALFVAAVAPLYLYNLRAAATHKPLRTAVSTPIALLCLFAFFHRMARLADRHGDDERAVA